MRAGCAGLPRSSASSSSRAGWVGFSAVGADGVWDEPGSRNPARGRRSGGGRQGPRSGERRRGGGARPRCRPGAGPERVRHAAQRHRAARRAGVRSGAVGGSSRRGARRASGARCGGSRAGATPAHGAGREWEVALRPRSGDPALASKEFLAVASLAVPRGDAAAAERRDKAYLQLARLAYQRGDDALATNLYDRVGRGAPQWLDALFEASWAHFRRSEDEKALGNLLTLHAPFFQERFFPESFILKALLLYENCRYADARAALADFQRRYQPLHDGLAQALAGIPTPQAAAELLARGPVGVQQAVPAAAREEVARIEQASDLRGALAAAAQLAQEIDSIDRRRDAFRASELVARVAPPARQARARLLETAGRRLMTRLDHERATLRELLGQSLRLSYEIAGREKELATSGPDAALSAQPHRDPPQVGYDEELWPFQGEYWRDELGSYRYQLGRRCKRPRTPAPTASQPAASPPAAVAGPPAD